MLFKPTPLLLATLLTLATTASQAHMSYGNRNLGTLLNGSQITLANQTVTSNYGWADAADHSLVFDPSLGSQTRVDNLALGDAHKGRAFRLHLDQTLSLSFTAAAQANATATSLGGLLPGFSVYRGLFATSPYAAPQTSADYDSAAASLAWRSAWAQSQLGAQYDHSATQGSWNALGDWKMGGDGDPVGQASALSSLSFMGYGRDLDRDGRASLTLTLGPGDYTVLVGGDDIASKGSATANSAYGLSLSVSAVPEPASALLLLLGLPLVAGLRRRAAQS